jgi:hypothetical protein
MKLRNLGLAALSALTAASVLAGVPKDLPYPKGGALTADQIMEQVYFVNHFYALKNYSIIEDGDNITVIINKAAGEAPTTNTVERHLNNTYDDGQTKAKDIAIFRSGKLNGTGMLIVDYVDDAKSQSYSIWLPALRKIRRFAEPAFDDAWGGTDFTFEDVYLRKPMHETHELVGKETFKDCLGVMALQDSDKNKYMQSLPGPFCEPKGKEVYKVKSTTKFKNWYYDYRISYIDAKTFADYRSEYFKDGKMSKVIDRAWASLNQADPRALSWAYWYGKDLGTNHETWAVIPASVVKFNRDMDANFWSETTLEKIKR